MTFEPTCLHQHVLDFYRKAGFLRLPREHSNLTVEGPRRINGSGQYFEQSLYFLLGHLLPDYDPLAGELRVTAKQLELRYRLPADCAGHAPRISRRITGDRHFQRFLETTGTLWLVEEPDRLDPSLRVGLVYPLRPAPASRKLSVLDLDGLAERYSDRGIGLEIAETFVTNASFQISLIRTAVRGLDWAKTHRLAHSLKGGAMNIGAESLADSARNLERAVKEQRFQTVPELLRDMENDCQALESAWRSQHGVIYG
jgi:HPt (histidine-containing phosphotransfer) domain-containing protein